MIDTDKYEGHTPAPWQASHDRLEHGWVVNCYGWRVYVGEHEKRAEIQNYAFDHDELSEPNARLIADAPLLLEAYKQIHDLLAEVLPRKDGVPHFGVTLWGLESELKRVVSEIAIIMGMAEREEE